MVDNSNLLKDGSQSFPTVDFVTNVKTLRATSRLQYSCSPRVGGCLQSYNKFVTNLSMWRAARRLQESYTPLVGGCLQLKEVLNV